MTIPTERLDQIAHRFAELEARMASGTLEGAAFIQASRDYAELDQLAKAAGLVAAMREEVAALIAQVRAETLVEVARVKTESESERLAAVTAELAQALDEISQVMRLIESSQYHATTEARLRSLIEGAAARITRGQGDLFAGAGHGGAPSSTEGLS